MPTHPFLAQLIEHSGLSSLAKKLEADSRLMSFIALLCIVAICFMATTFATDAETALFSVVWICFISAGLLVLHHSGVYAAGMSSSRSLLTILLILAQMLGVQVVFKAMEYVPAQLDYTFLLYFIPWMFAPGISSILIGRRMGMFVSLAVALLGVVICPMQADTIVRVIYLTTSMLAGSVAASLCGRVHKREQILRAGFIVGLINFACIFTLGRLLGDTPLQWERCLLEFTVALGMSFIYSVFISGFMPVLERIFNLSTPITWLELGDMNHPLLKELAEKAPGTFHHSITVSRIAESAAEKIGANPTHSAVCALFHDIGKLDKPQYFAENINAYMANPHDELSPDMSALIITDHVKNGIRLAQEHKLNSRIIDAIREHHGRSNAYFFYRKALDHYEKEMQRFQEGLLDSEPEPVDIEDYSYPGPRPQTKESGIVSMADAVESATRSLNHPTEAEIKEMIDSIFKGRILDGHLNDSQLSLGELQRMKDSFFASIKSMHHNRIAYPKPKEEEDAQLLANEGADEGGDESAAEGSASESSDAQQA